MSVSNDEISRDVKHTGPPGRALQGAALLWHEDV